MLLHRTGNHACCLCAFVGGAVKTECDVCVFGSGWGEELTLLEECFWQDNAKKRNILWISGPISPYLVCFR